MASGETLGFLKSRHRFWKSNSSRKSRNGKSTDVKKKFLDRTLELDLSNIQFLDDDNPLQEKVEVVEEKFKLKKYYNFQDMYPEDDLEPFDEISISSNPDEIDELFV